MKWDAVEAKAALARDIVAFGNSEGGGAIVIGKKELDDGTFEIDGLTPEQSSSFDTAAVAAWINARFEPAVVFTCHRVLYDGKRVVVILINEFNELPAICVKECHVSGKGDLISRGEIIIRTQSGASTKLQTREQLSSLIARAVLKREDQLREIFDRVVTGRAAENKPTDESRFMTSAREVESALVCDLANVTNLGAWRFQMHSDTFEPKWSTPQDLSAIIKRRQVNRWESFPTRYIRPLPTEWGVAEGTHYRIAWGITYEGLFVFWKDYTENQSSFKSPWVRVEGARDPDVPAGGWMDSVWSIYQICMFADFASKYAAEFNAATQLRLSIEATGLKGRQLLCTDPMVSVADAGDYPASKAGTFRFSRTHPAGIIQADWRELAVDAAHSFLQLFPVGLQIARLTTEKWVEKYATGTVKW